MSRILERIVDKVIPDPQLFDFEITTKIPREKLVYVICEFYWSMGHKSIIVIRNPKDYGKFIDYNPTLEIEKADEIQKISVTTHKKKENKQKFDSVAMSFEKDGIGKTKINWHVDFGYKIWQFIYFIIAFFIGLHYAGKLYIGWIGSLIMIALLVPMFYWSFHRMKKLENHPSIERYKKEFKDMIRQKEREMFPDDY